MIGVTPPEEVLSSLATRSGALGWSLEASENLRQWEQEVSQDQCGAFLVKKTGNATDKVKESIFAIGDSCAAVLLVGRCVDIVAADNPHKVAEIMLCYYS